MFSHKEILKVNKSMYSFQLLSYKRNASNVSFLSFELVIHRHPGMSASLPFPIAPGNMCCFKGRLSFPDDIFLMSPLSFQSLKKMKENETIDTFQGGDQSSKEKWNKTKFNLRF